MKIAIISDTHFGDPMCTLFARDKNGKIVEGSGYTKFRDAAGQDNDYLVLAGDTIDLSIENYKDAYEVARAFFLQIQKDNIAKEIIYIPGNHDFDIWHTYEYQVNVIRKIEKGKPAAHFRWSVPGVIDDRTDSANRGLTIPGVSDRTDSDEHRYGGLFLDNITKPEGASTTFNFAYPNLYIATDEESVIVTHGHYLDAFWSMTGDWSLKITRDDLNVGQVLDLKEMVSINFPLCQLTSSGIGQAGPLTKVIRQVQRDVKDKELNDVEIYLERFRNEVDKLTKFPWYGEIVETWVSKKVKKMFLESLRKTDVARYSDSFIHKQEVKDRFWKYYQASMIEINEINSKYRLNIPMPWFVIFGHTHRTIPWGADNPPQTNPLGVTDMRPVKLYNSGGWLNKLDDRSQIEFCGAEVFKYETGKGFQSIAIA